jgi:hypothetical protein
MKILPLKGVSCDNRDISLEVISPPMASTAFKENQESEDDGLDRSGNEQEPSKKRRQVSLEQDIPHTPLGKVVADATKASTVPSPRPTPSSSSQEEEDTHDRTSRDYYFDSYSHHAIRKFRFRQRSPSSQSSI